MKNCFFTKKTSIYSRSFPGLPEEADREAQKADKAQDSDESTSEKEDEETIRESWGEDKDGMNKPPCT